MAGEVILIFFSNNQHSYYLLAHGESDAELSIVHFPSSSFVVILYLIYFLLLSTKRRDRVVRTLVVYSGIPSSNLGPKTGYSDK